MDLNELRGERVGVLMSGGLSCTAVAAALAESGVDVTCFVADIGQPVPLPPGELVAALDKQGLRTEVVDLRDRQAELYITMLRYQASYEGGYWNTTSASREVLVAGLADALRGADCSVLAHGCVGGGNDQTRFARYGAALAPDLTVFTPWNAPSLVERFPNRTAMAQHLNKLGYPDEIVQAATYSVDGNVGGFSHESADLEGLDTPSEALRPIMTVAPKDAPDAVEEFTARFEHGRPVEVNGTAVTALEALLAANEAGGRNGISLRSVVENRVNGTKCRGTYESPGLDVLSHCLTYLYQATVDKASAELFRLLSPRMGRAVYEGRLHQVDTRAAAAALDTLTEPASGTVTLGLYKGNIVFHGLSDLNDHPGTERQTRFSNGGHTWHVQD